MKQYQLSTSIFLLWFTMSAAAQDMEITKSETVVAIYTNDRGLRSSGDPKLIASIWGDGTIVWSEDRIKGGTPYFKSKLDPKVVSATLNRISAIGIFDVPSLKQPNFGPDSEFTSILIRMNGKELKMESWHELYESNGKVVAKESGLTSLNGQKLLNALADQSADYLHYRMTWLELRFAVASLIPTTGAEAIGKPEMSKGNLSWKSTTSK